jgi:hypothetical protein
MRMRVGIHSAAFNAVGKGEQVFLKERKENSSRSFTRWKYAIIFLLACIL